MSKRKIFLDFDGTIINSAKAFCSIYNDAYQFQPNFKSARWWEVNDYGFKDECPLLTNIHDIFSSPLFFDRVEFMCANTKEIIEQLCDKYHVIICSIGTPENLSHKSLWLKDNLPCIKDYILIHNQGNKMDKSIINMSDGIIIDDVASNLETSNAKLKICFGEDYSWNESFDGKRVQNWTDLGIMLL